MKRLSRDRRRKLAQDVEAVARTLDTARSEHGMRIDRLDLATAVDQLLRRGPTADARALARRTAADVFYAREIAPNWNDLTPQARRERVEAFAQLANMLPPDAAHELEPLLRTKLLVLAWAYDTAHHGNLLRRLSRRPQSFGQLERR